MVRITCRDIPKVCCARFSSLCGKKIDPDRQSTLSSPDAAMLGTVHVAWDPDESVTVARGAGALLFSGGKKMQNLRLIEFLNLHTSYTKIIQCALQ